ncbi:hypothetical protein RHMOL_Rhmol05G0166700 [Rhododendron molle]|uniref:Uncharacterized protein n=1 Tax=Rhododendron molle TaxID=49168 RepID=A0ACC0NRE8_RHOML|nr:hypothetical protein RHMOL_Rhmol05G0166700 [Rhododendron molle]
MANNEVIEVSGESGDGPWPTRNVKIFIRLMDEEVKSKKSRETGTFTGEAWKRIKSELKRLTAYNYTNEQVNKYVRKFKKKGMPYYHELCHIFRDTSATGVHVHPPNKVPSGSDSSDLEFKIIDEPEVESAGGSKTKPKAKNKKRDSIAANIQVP